MPASTMAAENAGIAMDDSLSIINPFPGLLEGPKLLHQLVRGPEHDAVALDYTDGDGKRIRLSYSELHAQAERLAYLLIQQRRQTSQGNPGIIPLYISQCPSLYISLLAILKSGAAFCPLNLDVPTERLKFILEDTSASVILTTTQLRSKLPDLQNVKIIEVDDEVALSSLPASGDFRIEDTHNSMTSNPLAYIMYTSGSTGLPKAVCLPHKAATQSLLAHDKHIPNFSRFLQFASPTFDVSVFEIFFPWMRGCTLVSCDRGRLLGDLPGMITELEIDAAELTPSVAASLVRKRENVPTLKTLLTIGEMLNAQVIQEFGGSTSRASMLYGMYGPTEAAIHCTLQPSFAAELPAGTIGIPLDTVSCFIVKPAESAQTAGVIEILPIGEVGELAVGGHQLALGYLNREEQTRAAFVSHPEYGDLYRTGDKARLLPNGTLECQGRISSGQVKLRGQRIELGEIEHAASKVDGCHAVVASVISGQLVIFCIVEDDVVTVDAMKDGCRKWLPNYMVPSDVVLLGDFPYLPSGKVDKRKLEGDYTSSQIKVESAAQHMSEDLTKVMKIIRRVLQIPIDSATDLGTSGLDSLKAIQVATGLRKEGYGHIGALDLLAAPTARDLEELIRRNPKPTSEPNGLTERKQKLLSDLRAAVTKTSDIGHRREGLEDVLPCTPLQDAMLSETTRDPQAYCNSFTLSMSAEVQLSHLRQYLHLLARRHSLLRSGFCISNSPISAFSQLAWDSINDDQILEVDKFSYDYKLSDPAMLLQPLQVQIRKTTDRIEALFQIHHALYDQWSIDILIEDLGDLLRGREIPSRPSFGLVNEFFLDLKMSPDSQSESLVFWQEYLSSALPGRLPLLNGESLPVAPLANVTLTMDVDMSALQVAAKQSGCSPHVFFQAIYAYLLGLYMGTNDVTFGTVFSGRTLPIAEVESIIGPILSTLPTHINVSEARKFSDILRRLQEDNRSVMQHSTVSLADIRKVASTSPGQALFDSIFVWQETTHTPLQGKNVVELQDTRDYLEFNLTLELEPLERGIRAKATYQPTVLLPEVVESMLRQIEQIAKHVVQSPDALVNDLIQSLEPSLLSINNEEPQNFVFERGLGSVLERHAAETPGKPAICFATDIDENNVKTEILTFGELNSRANKLAHYLISIGTLPDELVCIFMDKSVDLYVGILAIVKTGAAYLPLIAETPLARVRQILKQSEVRTCLTSAETSSIISDMGLCRSINLARTDASSQSPSSPQVPFDPSHLAYAVFTSGTTGTPKGVLVTQENILSNLAVLERIYPVSGYSRLLQACNHGFDVSVFEIFFSWSTGMCLCTATKDVLFRDLENAINQLGVTHLSLTPTVAALTNPENLPKVELLVISGEALTHKVCDAWAGRGLYQGYGPSETTNICTIQPFASQPHAINNIGLAFENTSAFVLSDRTEFQPLPSGALGELCYGGQQVFRGYQNMAELTDKKIVRHPVYGRIYRSGDLGRMLPNGTMLIEGRIDDQRKLRGQRIELGEISSILLRLPVIRDCLVQIVGEVKEQERLIAFWILKERCSHEYSIITPNEETRGLIGSIYESLSDELPTYMVPAALIPVTALPRTSQGKIDRKKLIHDMSQLAPEALNNFSQVFEDGADAESMSETERALVVALADVLQIPEASIKRTMSFFAIGLDSVSAIRFSRAIKTRFGTQVDVSTILKRSNLARLAIAIEGRTMNAVATSPEYTKESIARILGEGLTDPVAKHFESSGKSIQSILPCTPLQEAMLSASSTKSDGAYYNRTLFKITGDISKLKDCWGVMLERHEILRTAFTATDDARFPYLQVVLAEFALPWDNLAGETKHVGSLLKQDSQDDAIPVLGVAPPYALKTYTSADGDYLLLEMHHAMYDGNAMSNLLRDIEEAYQGIPLIAPSKLTPFLEHMLSVDPKAADDFFKLQLDDYIPKAFIRPKVYESRHGFGVVEASLRVPQSTIQDYLRRHTVSLLGLVQATWVRVLSISQGCSDVCFGNVLSGRSAPVEGIQTLVAPCFNTIPIRVDVASIQSNLALIKMLQQVNVEMLAHQLTPLRRIQANAPVKSQRLFDSLILLQQEPEALDENIWSLYGETGEMDFPCIIEVTPTKDSFSLSLHFDRKYFGDGDIPKQLCTAFVAALSSCITYPSSDVSDLIDFDKQQVAGLLKPDKDLMIQAKTEMKERSDDNAHIPSGEQWSSLEIEIRQTFSAISGTPVDRISKNTSIYRIGLDSISAIQVAGRLRKKGISLTAGDIMESPSCSQLASVVQSRTATPVKNSPAFDLEAFDRRHRQRTLANIRSHSEISAVRPCTAVQSGMLSQYLQTDGEQYLNHTFYVVDSDVDASRLLGAWYSVIENHEMLRTGFSATEDRKHPFAMITYAKIAPESTWLRMDPGKNQVKSFSEHQKMAADAIQKDISSPPWRWDLFHHENNECLQFSAHHAIFDAETLRLIQVDLHRALAGDQVQSRESIDSALSLIVAASSNARDEQQAFWRHQMEDLAVTRFPNLSPTRVGEQKPIVLSSICERSRSQLEARCREMGTSLQAAGQAAWARLLAAYTGETKVTFGVVFSGRTTPETTSSPFPCITTLPLPADTTQSDEELLHSLTTYNASSQKHQFTPLTDIQRFAGSPNEALFDTLFAYQKPFHDTSAISMWQIIHETASVDYPISIEMECLSQDELGFRLTINPHQVPPQQGQIVLGQLEALLISVLDASATIDKSYQSMVPAKDPLIPTDVRYVHDFVTSAVATHPDEIALEFVTDLDDGEIVSRKWTYDQLDQESNRIAQLLVRNGVQPNSVIATSFDKCPEASFAFLGILKAGCAFCAIDSTAPTARKAFILEDSKASLMLTNSSIVSELGHIVKCKIIDIAASDALETSSEQPIPSPQLSPSSVSYVLYTSGTTGTPKGCELTHDNVVQALLAFRRLFEGRWDENSRWLQFASYHFDVAVLEQFWTWSVGIRLVCAPRDLILEDLPGFINTMQITHLDLTPSLGRLLDPASVPSLHQGVFITGGEALKQDMIDSWGEIGCLFNFYGPTECTIGVTTFPSVPRQGKPSNIGWQFDNVGTYVLAPGTKQPVLRGAIGELCISGKLVGKGYLNRPELTEDRFPTLEKLDERIYRTGDLVRLLHDNSIEFLGRQDNQVKLRGQRLEIDEIEAVIRQCPEIQDVVCLVAKHPKQQKDLLVGFIAMSSARRQCEPKACSAESTREQITMARTACEEHLPGYMVPTHFIPVEVIPLSVNNKIEEKQLRSLYGSLSAAVVQDYSTQSQDTKPLNGVERSIARVLATLLSIDTNEMQPSSNVFALGLSSISAIQFSRKLKAEGYSNAQVATVMQHATIGKLAKVLSSSTRQESGEVTAAKQNMAACQQRYRTLSARVLGGQADQYEAVYPCTPLQQGIISRSLGVGSSLYFNTFRYSLQCADTTKLRDSFETALNKVQILRAAFIETDDGYVQVIRRNTPLVWLEIDCPTTGDLEISLEQRRADWRSSNNPHITSPFEVVLANTSAGKVLEIHLHHAIYDGNSYQMLLEHITQLYKGRTADFGKPFTDILPYGPLRDVNGAKEFWLNHLSGADRAVMPRLSEEANEDTLYTESVGQLSGVENVRRSLNVTSQAVIQAAWAATIRRYYQGAIGTVVSGRAVDFDGAETVIGPLFNTVPFNPTIADGDSWQILVRRCHDYNISALPFQHTSLREIIKWSKARPSEPLFDTLFVFQNSDTLDSTDEQIFVLQEETSVQADYPLSFEAEETIDGIVRVTISAKRSVCSYDKAKDLVHEFEHALSTMIKAPEVSIAKSLEFDFAHSKATRPERSAEDLNGVHDFVWSSDALILRSEIASLAAVDEIEVDEHVSIFELGLDSVDAVKLSSRLKKKGMSVAVSALMKSQTVPRILGALTKSKETSSLGHTRSILQEYEPRLTSYVKSQLQSTGNIERILPASPMQEALISEMIKSSYGAYFNHDVLKIHDYVDVARLEQAWETVVNNNSILRTGFEAIADPDIDATFAQVIRKPSLFRLERTEIPDDDFERYMQDIQTLFSTKSSNVPQFRLTLANTPSGCYLIISIAHALYDGYSLTLLHQDVLDAYHDRPTQRPFYGEILEQAFHESTQDSIPFWRSLLSGATRTHISPGSGGNTLESTTHRKEKVSSSSSRMLAQFCKKQGITIQALCQTAWAFTLAHYTQTLDVMYGVVLAGRNNQLAEQVMFPTMNTVAMRSVLHGSRRDMLQYMQNTIADLTEHQHYPLRKIQASCQREVQFSSSNTSEAFFDSLFTYQKRPGAAVDTSDLLYESVNGASDVEYPVAVEAEVLDDNLVWRTACKSSVLAEQGTTELLDRLDTVLSGIISRCESPSFYFDDQGVSICELPAFKRPGTSAKSIPRPVAESDGPDQPSSWSTEECHIREVIAQVTKTPEDEVMKRASLQNLGVDSINAIKISSILRKRSIKISVSEIIKAGSIEKITAFVQKSSTQESTVQVSSEQALSTFISQNNVSAKQFGYNTDDVEQILPATAGQIYMLSSWQTTRGEIFFPEFKYIIKEKFDPVDVQRVWQDLVDRHQILRTVFCTTGSKDAPFAQLVLRRSTASFIGLDDPENLEHATIKQPFARLSTRKVDGGLQISLKIHHALYDAISLPLLVSDLEHGLNSSMAIPHQIKFSDFIAMNVGDEATKRRESFWKQYLQTTQAPQLPISATSPSSGRVESFDPSVIPMDFHAETTLRKQGLTLQALFFAAHAKAYAGLASSGADNNDKDVVIGIYLANRSHLDDLSSLSAPTVNLVPLRVRDPQGANLLSSAVQIQADLAVIGSPENSSVGLWEIEKWTGVRVDNFVNFIKLPDTSSAAESESQEEPRDDGAIVIEEADTGLRTEKRSLVHPVHAANFTQPEELENNPVRDSYPLSLDVEATVANGALSVGVFGWEDMIGLNEADKLTQEIVRSLKEALRV